MESVVKEYRSPVSKLAKHFERGRNKWRTRSKAARQRIRLLQTNVCDLRASRETWKQKAKEAKAEVARLQAELEELKIGLRSQ